MQRPTFKGFRLSSTGDPHLTNEPVLCQVVTCERKKKTHRNHTVEAVVTMIKRRRKEEQIVKKKAYKYIEYLIHLILELIYQF